MNPTEMQPGDIAATLAALLRVSRVAQEAHAAAECLTDAALPQTLLLAEWLAEVLETKLAEGKAA